MRGRERKGRGSGRVWKQCSRLLLVVEVRLKNPSRLTGDVGTDLPSLSSETAHRLSLQPGGGLQVARQRKRERELGVYWLISKLLSEKAPCSVGACGWAARRLLANPPLACSPFCLLQVLWVLRSRAVVTPACLKHVPGDLGQSLLFRGRLPCSPPMFLTEKKKKIPF